MPVTVNDDDRGTVLIDANPATAALDPGPLLLAEGDTGAYTVRLSARPTANATVAVTSGDTGAVTVDLASLTFTTTNWATPQTVTATAVAEASDSVDESVLVSHEATGGGYGGTSSDLRVGVSDAERTGTDYDTDEDGLIEISTLAQLNAVRWDLDGDGAVSSSNTANYSGASGAFASASTGMGCPTGGCGGYELARDLDFDTDGDGATHTSGTSDAQDTYHNSGSGWDPIGPASTPSDSTHFNATFDGNGHSIHNLYVNRNRNYGGLFAALRGSAVVRSLGLPNAYVNISQQGSAAPLAGESIGRVEAVWASGSAAGNTNVGGLLGQNLAGGVVVASYSKASTQCGNGSAAGLVANNLGAIVASYATGAITGSCAASLKHGLAGGTGTATASHWDRETSGVATSTLMGTGRTTAQLQTPTSAQGIYAGWWNLDVDGDGDRAEAPWHFGTSSQYPALSYRGARGGEHPRSYRDADVVQQRGDYDLDNDGLIEVYDLAQLNAMRWDLDGDGTASSAASYGKAFRNHVSGMGCPAVGGCTGYELENDLDFDTDGDGSTHTGGTGDSGDAYYNSGAGWPPIPTQFTATFDGNGKVIANLFVSVVNGTAALFTDLRAGAVVRALGLPDAYVSGTGATAPLAGRVWGRVAAVWVTGEAQGDTNVGGLVGAANGGSTIVASYTTATVACIGGSPSYRAGGLTSISFGSVLASYSTGTVTGGCPGKAGLAAISGSGSAQASYWDTDRSNIADDSGSAAPEGVTSANLRNPTGYSGIYALWDNQDVDGDTLIGAAADADDDAWDFGDQWQWPVLKFGGHDTARQIALQPNVAPTFGSGTVANKTYRKDFAIAAFQIPAASGGEGVGYTYEASGLPVGLVFEGGCGARRVCGTPTANTTGAATVTIYAHDGDTNREDSDRAMLTFTVTVVTPTATLAASNPTTLTEANLDGAEVTVTLADTAFASGVTQSRFTLVDNVPGLTIDSLATVSAGDATATLTLDYTGADFSAVRTVSVTVAAAAHDLPGTLASNSLSVTPTPGIALSRTTLALEEDPSAGGGTNANVGTYTIRLTANPTTAGGGNCNVNIEATSDNTDVSIDTDGSPQTKRVVFTHLDWNTPQTITATVAGDGDSQDDAATISHARVGSLCSGGFFGNPTLPSVTVNVNDDEAAGILLDADPSTPTMDEAGPLTLDELSTSSDNSKSYTVRLAAEPSQDVTVTITSGDTTAATVDKASLTFTSSNWNTRQTVTVTAVQDNDSDGESVTITHAASTTAMSEYTNVQATITASLTDKDTPGFVFDADPSSPATDEAGPLQLVEDHATDASKEYTVRLSAQPTQTVTATIATSDATAVTVDDTDTNTPGDQSTLTFTSSNWSTPQTVTLTAQADDGGANESVTITHSAATATSSEYTNVSANFTATVDDDETPAITLSASSLSVPEENSANYTVRLATQPEGGNVTVSITGAADGISTNLTSLVFTSANWSTARTVRATAANDQNGDNEQVTLTHAASGGEYNDAADADLVVTATDNDTASLAVSPASLTVRENSSATYRIRLNTQPSADVTVTVSGASGAVTVDTDAAVGNQNTLTFTNTNWAANQTVTVAAGDDGNAQNEMLTLAHGATGGGYGSLPLGSRPGVQVTVDDDDTAGILLDADPDTPNDQSGPLALNENPAASNNSVEYTVRLASEPTMATTTVSIVSSEAAVTVGSAALTFTPTNWSTPQTVTLTAADDDNGVPESATITHTSATASASEYTNLMATITANTTDDDAPSFVFDADPDTANDQAGPLALEEDQTSSTNSDDYTVRLSARPTRTVTATITSGDASSVTVGDTDGDTLGVQNTLTFTASNWDTPQTVTLTAQQDDNGYNESVTITHRARTTPNSEYTNVSGNFTASVDDDETPAITLSASALSVPEENSATYTVRLATEPVGGNVTVDITGAADSLSASPTRLVFNTGNWDTARTVRITAANDQNGENETVTFSHAASGADYGSVAAAEIVATSTDNDTPSLQVTPTTLEVDENSSGRYTIRLSTQPSAAVTVTVSGASGAVTVDTDAAVGNQDTLTFSTTNWSARQTVTVAAGDDGNAVNETLTLTHAATGGDYGSLPSDSRPSVQVTVDDDDTAGILLDADPDTPNDQSGPLALDELSTSTENSVSYTVRLSSEPTQDVTVTITSGDTTAVTVNDTHADPGVQNTLTFTSANWNTPQTVTLTAAQDTDGVGENVTITHAASTASTSEYTNIQATITANTTDAQAAGFVFDADPSSPATDEAGPLSLTEDHASDASKEYTVRLTSQPTQTVTATLTSANTAAVTVGDTDGGNPGVQNTLTFTSSNWNTPQTVTLTAQADDNGYDETVAVAHAAATTPSSEYTNVTGSFSATVTDDETPGITLSDSSLTVDERDSAPYTVALDTEPVGGNVTVDITGAADSLSARPSRLVFTAGNWNTARTVRVSAANDDNSDNEMVTFRHTASGADYGGVSAVDLTATAQDDDLPGLLVNPESLTVLEGRTATYRLRLNTQPSAAVTVTVSASTGKAAVDTDPGTTGDQTQMAFDATNWSRWRTVRVTGAEDGDGDDETVALSHAATGAAEYTGLALNARPGVAVTVTDDDEPTIELSAATLGLSEGDPLDAEGFWEVRLANLAPNGTVSVSVTSGDPAVAILSAPVTLTFDATTWRTWQTVRARAVDDDDAASERVEVRHAASGANYGGAEAVLRVLVTDDEAPPAEPRGLTATPGDGRATLRWRNPQNPSITRYEHRYAEEGDRLGSWRRVSGSGPGTTSLTVSGLINGRAYEFELRAGNEIGDSPAARTAARLAGAPGATVLLPDPALTAAAREVVGRSASEPLTAGDLATVLELDLSLPAPSAGRLRPPQTGGEPVRNLRGIEAMVNLRRLWVDHNAVGDISPLLALRYLQLVSLRGNPLTSDSVYVYATSLRARGVEVLLDGATLATVNDPGLRRALEIALGKDSGATLTEGDLLTLSSLSAGSAGVASLAGLEAASRLESLTLSGNAPAAGGAALDLSPLAGLRSLSHLDLSDNDLADVSALSGLTGLRDLLLSGNALRDLSPLSELAELRSLTLSNNGLTDVSALSGLSSLRQLWLDGNELESIRPLRRLRSLIYLHLGDNRIEDVSPLTWLGDLRRLWLPGNEVADVSALSGLWSLQRLDLSRNRVWDVSPLAGLTDLSQLRLGWNLVENVSALSGHRGLTDGGTLGLRGNPLRSAALWRHVPDLRAAGAAVVVGWPAPLFPAVADPSGRGGFVRVLNRSDADGEVLIEALDEAGRRFGPLRLPLRARSAAHFNSTDLENGNAAKGLVEGIGPPAQGSWRLLVSSTLDIEVLAYVRASDGFLTAMHGELPRDGDSLSAFVFNPASNRAQRSSLRVHNPGAADARVWPWGVDDAGRGRLAAPLTARAGATVSVSALFGVVPPRRPRPGQRRGQVAVASGRAVAAVGAGAAGKPHRPPLEPVGGAGVRRLGGRLGRRVGLGHMGRPRAAPAAVPVVGVRVGPRGLRPRGQPRPVGGLGRGGGGGRRRRPRRPGAPAPATPRRRPLQLGGLGERQRGERPAGRRGRADPRRVALGTARQRGVRRRGLRPPRRRLPDEPARDRPGRGRRSARGGVQPGVQHPPAQLPAPRQQRHGAGARHHHRPGRRRRRSGPGGRHRAGRRGPDPYRRSIGAGRRGPERRPRRRRRQVAPHRLLRQPAGGDEPDGKPRRPPLQPLRHHPAVKSRGARNAEPSAGGAFGGRDRACLGAGQTAPWCPRRVLLGGVGGAAQSAAAIVAAGRRGAARGAVDRLRLPAAAGWRIRCGGGSDHWRSAG